MPSPSLVWTVLSLAALAAGAWLLYGGLTRYRQRKLMQETRTTDIWHVDPGPIEITGTARPVDGETLRAPFTEETCLAADWEIEEWDESGKHSDWHSKGGGVASVSAFAVEDDTGTMLVRPDGADFDVDEFAEETVEVGGPEDPPEPIRRFLSSDATPGRSDAPLLESLDWGNQEGDRRYHQHLLEPGEEVYVYGTVHPRGEAVAPSTPEQMEIRRADEREEPMFLISDRPQEDLVRSRTYGLWRVPAGLVLAVVGAWILLVGYGVVG